MRIIAGKYRGRKLFEPEDKLIIRATQDRIKESVFNSLQEMFLNSHVLDCFCGTGALGLEALSRGAFSVTFIDSSTYSLNLAKQNFNLITQSNAGKQSIEETVASVDFILGDYKKVFNNLLENKKTFDIIFMDPPYNKDDNGECVKFAFENKLVNSNGVVVFETSNGNIDFSFLNLEVKKKKYGKKFVYLIFLNF